MNSKALPPLSLLAKTEIINGLYEHYKGFRYKVIAVARHSETLEELIVYQALYGEEDIWVRPLAMFLENIEINGQFQPRLYSSDTPPSSGYLNEKCDRVKF